MEILTAVGNVVEVRINKRNLMKYLVEFNDLNGHPHKVWSNWTSKKSFQPGVSLPIKYVSIPGTFGFGVAITNLDDIPQYNEALLHVGMGAAVVAAAAAGFIVGKFLDD